MISGISQYTNFSGGVTAMSTRPRPEEMFAKMDSNGDEYVDRAEFSSFHQQMAGKTGDASRLEEMFSQIDTDGDGKISKAEDSAFLASMKDRPAPPPMGQTFGEDPLTEIFSAMDTNSDGAVDKAELDSYLLKMTNQAESENSSDELFGKIDSDGDGQISKSENDNFIEQMMAGVLERLQDTSSSQDDASNPASSLSLVAQRYSQSATGNSQSVLDLQG